jgi:hypothetical protein
MEDVLPSMNPNVLGRLKYEAESLDDDDRGGGVDSEPEEEEDDWWTSDGILIALAARRNSWRKSWQKGYT